MAELARSRRLSRTQGLGFTYAPGYNAQPAAGPAVAPDAVRVLIACDNDPEDPRAYSGTLRSVLDAVRGMACVEVVGVVDCSRALGQSLDGGAGAGFLERYGETALVAAAAADLGGGGCYCHVAAELRPLYEAAGFRQAAAPAADAPKDVRLMWDEHTELVKKREKKSSVGELVLMTLRVGDST